MTFEFVPFEGREEANERPVTQTAPAPKKKKRRGYLESAARIPQIALNKALTALLSAPGEVASLLSQPVGGESAKSIENPNSLIPRALKFISGVSNKENAEKLLGHLEPETQPERVTTNIAELLGSTAGLGSAPKTLKGLAALTGWGTAEGLAEEVSDNPWINLLSGALGGIGTRAALGGSKKVPVKKAQEAVEKLRQEGYEVPLEVRAPNKVSTAIQQSGRYVSPGAVEQQAENVSAPVRKKLGELIKEISTQTFEGLEDFGTKVQEILKESAETANSLVRDAYEAARGKIPPGLRIPAKKVIEKINKIEEALTKAWVPNDAEKKALAIIRELKQKARLAGKKGEYLEADKLVAQLQSLNATLGEPIAEGALKLISGLRGDIDKAIRTAAKDYPEFLEEYVKAKDFAHSVYGDVRTNKVKRLLSQETPEKVASAISTSSGLKDLEKALSYTPEGIKAYKAVRAQVAKNLFKPAIGKNGAIDFRKLNSIINDPETREIVKTAVGEEGYQTLKHLDQLSSLILERGKGYLKGGGPEHAKWAETLSYLYPIFEVITGKLTAGASTAAGLAGKKVIYSSLSNPKFLDKLSKLGKAMKHDAPEDALRYATSLVREVEKEKTGSKKGKAEGLKNFELGSKTE